MFSELTKPVLITSGECVKKFLKIIIKYIKKSHMDIWNTFDIIN